MGRSHRGRPQTDIKGEAERLVGPFTIRENCTTHCFSSRGEHLCITALDGTFQNIPSQEGHATDCKSGYLEQNGQTSTLDFIGSCIVYVCIVRYIKHNKAKTLTIFNTFYLISLENMHFS